jgi:hypothetical protein
MRKSFIDSVSNITKTPRKWIIFHNIFSARLQIPSTFELLRYSFWES